MPFFFFNPKVFKHTSELPPRMTRYSPGRALDALSRDYVANETNFSSVLFC